MVESRWSGNELAQRVKSLAAYLSRIVDSREVFDELVAARAERDPVRFRRALERIPNPDDLGPYEPICFWICETLNQDTAGKWIATCFWAQSGEVVSEEDLRSLREVQFGSTGRTVLDVLIEHGDISCTMEREPEVLGACGEICFSTPSPRPKPPV